MSYFKLPTEKKELIIIIITIGVIEKAFHQFE